MKVNLFTQTRLAPKFTKESIASLLKTIVRVEQRKADIINVVLVDDDYLLEVNRKYLNHNYKTDVIAFDLNDGGTIDGEIYVSVDRAKVQAKRYRVNLYQEVLRLIIHGTLHLAGWEDTTRAEKLKMRKRENEYIERFYRRRRRR